VKKENQEKSQKADNIQFRPIAVRLFIAGNTYSRDVRKAHRNLVHCARTSTIYNTGLCNAPGQGLLRSQLPHNGHRGRSADAVGAGLEQGLHLGQRVDAARGFHAASAASHAAHQRHVGRGCAA